MNQTLMNKLYFLFQDYDGQGRAEFMSQTIIVIFGVVGLILGWYLQQFSQTVFIVAAGFIIAAIVSLNRCDLSGGVLRTRVNRD